MNMRITVTRLLAKFIALVILGSSLQLRPVQAQECTPEKSYDGTGLFRYSICNVPDLDQRRTTAEPFVEGLPNGGKMYCVPTSTMNWMTYIANHGYPNLLPGPGYWGPETPPVMPQYAEMTNALQMMGQLMNTDPEEGTAGATQAIELWLGTSGQVEDFVVSHYNASGNYSPSFPDMTFSAISGSLVIAVVGWYKTFENLSPETKALMIALGEDTNGLIRDGGHAVSMVKATRDDFGEQRIGVNDPASPKNTSTTDQSPFATDVHEVVAELHKFDGNTRVQGKVAGIGSAAYLDGYYAIRPKKGLAADQNFLIYLDPVQLLGDGFPTEPVVKTFLSATGGKIVDLALHPELTKHPYLIENSNTIWQLDVLTGRSIRFATVGNPKKIVFGGPDQNLFVLLPEHVISFGPDGRQKETSHLREPLADIAYDKLGNRLVGLSARGNKLFFFDSALNILDSEVLEMEPCIQPPSITIDPATAAVWLHCEGSNRLTRVNFGEDDRTTEMTQVTLEGLRNPVGLTVDDRGHLFINDGGLVYEFEANGNPAERSRFAGLRGGYQLDILRSFSNFDPATMSDIRFRNVLPEDANR